MTRVLSIGFAVAAITTAALAQVREAGAPDARTVRGGVAETARGPEQARKLLDTYCAGCHNARARNQTSSFWVAAGSRTEAASSPFICVSCTTAMYRTA